MGQRDRVIIAVSSSGYVAYYKGRRAFGVSALDASCNVLREKWQYTPSRPAYRRLEVDDMYSLIRGF